MSNVRLTRDLVADGYTNNELARQTRSGELRHLRRGAYAAVVAGEDSEALQHLRVVEATVRLAAPAAVVSHLSAAVVHGLPVVSNSIGRVQLTRADVPGGKNRGGIHLHAAPMDPTEVVEVNGIATTSLARTVVDLGRSLPAGPAVVTGDAALRQLGDREALESCLIKSAGRPGVSRARRVVSFLDALSESAGESLSRVALADLGLPAPTLQLVVRNDLGRVLGRADFGWEEHRTLGEFDGRVKYGRLLKPGDTIHEAVYREKLREDAFRDLGWQVVRWTWADLKTPAVIADRLLRAFARAGRSAC